jgi:hypothetical protein
VIRVTCEVECLTFDGKETTSMNASRPKLVFSTDALHPDRVYLRIGEHEVAVSGADLRAAVGNVSSRGGER